MPTRPNQQLIEPARIYALEEVCDLLGTSRETLYAHLADGSLIAVKTGRAWRILGENILEYLRGNGDNPSKAAPVAQE